MEEFISSRVSDGSGSWISNDTSFNNCSLSIPSRTPGFILTVQVVVGIVSLLSIFGSLLIIFTFIVFKDLRTTARHFLANLSVADSILSFSHFFGLFANYRRFLCDAETSEHDPLCTVQAAAAIVGTLAAFAWTLAIAVYMCSIVVFKRRAATWSIVVSYVACWGLPAILVIAYGARDYLGFDEAVDIGWCYLRRIDYSEDGVRNPIPHIIAYELWTYLIFLLLPILYIWVQCYIKIKIKRTAIYMDIKLIFVPIMFLLLRMWSFVLDSVIVYTSDDVAEDFKNSRAAAALILLSGIGDSGQGIVNAILFIGFTKVVRKRLIEMLRNGCCRRCSHNQWRVLQETDAMGDSMSNQPHDKDENRDTRENTTAERDNQERLQVHGLQQNYGTT